MNTLFSGVLSFIMILAVSQGAWSQTVTKYGDNVGTLDGIMKAYYDVVTVKKGELISYQRDSLLHIAGARVGRIKPGKTGNARLEYTTLKEWHRVSDPAIAKTGFYEKEIARKVEKFGGVYHVWSTYESRLAPDGKVIDRGINSIELYFDGSRFWIIAWVYDSERVGNPLPKEYLQ